MNDTSNTITRQIDMHAAIELLISKLTIFDGLDKGTVLNFKRHVNERV